MHTRLAWFYLLAHAEAGDQIAGMMQQAAGELARDYNRRKDRSGAFWEGRYHATMVDSGPCCDAGSGIGGM